MTSRTKMAKHIKQNTSNKDHFELKLLFAFIQLCPVIFKNFTPTRRQTELLSFLKRFTKSTFTKGKNSLKFVPSKELRVNKFAVSATCFYIKENDFCYFLFPTLLILLINENAYPTVTVSFVRKKKFFKEISAKAVSQIVFTNLKKLLSLSVFNEFFSSVVVTSNCDNEKGDEELRLEYKPVSRILANYNSPYVPLCRHKVELSNVLNKRKCVLYGRKVGKGVLEAGSKKLKKMPNVKLRVKNEVSNTVGMEGESVFRCLLYSENKEGNFVIAEKELHIENLDQCFEELVTEFEKRKNSVNGPSYLVTEYFLFFLLLMPQKSFFYLKANFTTSLLETAKFLEESFGILMKKNKESNKNYLVLQFGGTNVLETFKQYSK